MSGSNLTDQPEKYGTKGTGRSRQCSRVYSVISSTDASGNCTRIPFNAIICDPCSRETSNPYGA
jgi:hypothetical protein